MRVITLYASKLRQTALKEQLRRSDVQVDSAVSINDLLRLLRDRSPDAVLLEDVAPMLADWLAILRLREGAELPLLVVGMHGGIGISEALAQGASDYLDHEMPVERLVERLHAHAARREGSRHPVMQAGPFTLSEATMTIRCGTVEVNLTSREFSLARILFGSVGHVVPLHSLSARVWGASVDISKRTLEQHVYKLRRKLEAHFSTAVRIHAAYGVGYRLDLMVQAPSALATAQVGSNQIAASTSKGWDGVERRRSNTPATSQEPSPALLPSIG